MISDANYDAKQNETKGNASKITNSSCASKSRQQLRKFIKSDQTNCLFFVSVKTNH